MKQELKERLTKLTSIVSLETQSGWMSLLEDVKEGYKQISDSWFHVHDEKELQEARVHQLANEYLMNLMDNYKAEIQGLMKDIVIEENPNDFVKADVDNNPPDEEGVEEIY